MDRILRSVFQVGGQPETEEAYNNWLKLQEYPLEYYTEENQKIHKYLETFYNQMSAPPDMGLAKDYFEKLDDIETVERLTEISKSQFYIRTNYLSILRHEQEQQQTKRMILLCRDASSIAEHGRVLDAGFGKKISLRGAADAVNFLYERLHEFAWVEGGEKLEGVSSEDADEIINEYDIIEKTNKYSHRNLFGLEPIDAVCKGHRKGEYWIHCAFPGELKTSLSLNYMYNNIMVYGKNIFYAILEMPYSQLRRQLYVIHSSHGKFVTEWNSEDGYTGLDYRQVRDGELSPRNRERFKIVAQDFKATARGKPYIWRPSDHVSIEDIRRKAEMFHNKYGCDGIVIDHLGLVKTKRRYTDTVSSLNDVVRDGRLMALNFGRGRSVPVLALFQMNRQGKLRADKNDGRYDISAISYANECCAEGTLIKTQRGLVPIENIQPGEDLVWSKTGWKGVIGKYDNGAKRTFRVTTDRGIECRLTSSHRLRVMRDGQEEWIYVKDLQPGMFLISDFGTSPFPVDSIRLPELDFGKGEKSIMGNGIQLRVPEYLTEDLSYIIGAFYGDGKHTNIISLIGFILNRNEVHVLDKLQNSLENSFGSPFYVAQPPFISSTTDLNHLDKALSRWFNDVGIDRNPGLPDCILSAPRNMIVSFLKGFFDTNGRINNQGIISVNQKAENEKTLRQIQLLLSNLGIDSTLYWKWNKLDDHLFPSWVLRIRSRESRSLFLDLIGFTEPYKQQRLCEIVNHMQDSEKAGDFTQWPLGSIAKRLCDEYSSITWSRKVRYSIGRYIEYNEPLTTGCIQEIIDTLSMIAGTNNDYDILKNWFDTTRFIAVTGIQEYTDEKVWDLEVTGDHEYCTGGFLSHNCEKSADVITYTYLNDNLRKEGKFYLGCLKNRDNPPFDRMIGKILWQSRRMRAIESGMLDMDTDQLVSAARQITLGIDDIIEAA
jgi:intein/homing endonuclease